MLYGFGRIGRLLARILIAHTGGGQGLRLRAIVVRKGSANDLVKRASLLRRDSVHGPFAGTIEVDEQRNTILANGTLIQVIYSNDPATIDYTAYGIRDAVVVDNTGRWRDAEGLSQHLQSRGVARVLLTAPGKGAIKNIVHGINHGEIAPTDRILSAASCTTNAITPVLKAVRVARDPQPAARAPHRCADDVDDDGFGAHAIQPMTDARPSTRPAQPAAATDAAGSRSRCTGSRSGSTTGWVPAIASMTRTTWQL